MSRGLYLAGWGGFIEFPKRPREGGPQKRNVDSTADGFSDDALFRGRVSDALMSGHTTLLGATPNEIRDHRWQARRAQR